MAVQHASWEYRLLALANEALTTPAVDACIEIEEATLSAAYDYCAGITRAHSRTFHMAAAMLPLEKRRAVHALYAFCRCTDDLIDETAGLPHASDMVATWHARLNNPFFAAHDPVPLAWADAQARFRIPRGYARQLMDGVARDLIQTRYDTFADLTEYCYGVASTVGLMSMHIIGFRDDAALPYAVKLGIALQLTNILRDVGEDWRKGRFYLPLEELEAFNLTESDIGKGQVDERWRAFMQFQIQRIHQLYDEAAPGIAMLHSDGRFAIAAAAGLYRAILSDIEAHDYNVFDRRAHLGFWGKSSRLPGIWWQSKTGAR